MSSHSIIVSNVPADVGEGTLMRYVREMTEEGASVVHMQPFPDQYHFMNDSNNTKTWQLFFATSSEAATANMLFQSANAEHDLSTVHDTFNHADSSSHVPRTITQVDTWDDSGKQEAMRNKGRRISVTMI
ncbi:LADA_0D03268g1_1 [Lachancea dasiensis]|uniref:LADA_0D03268g1_1 n=1 Tax=Lachancea dasiensis TaxID=1072105 RepID=A0A1G4J4J8_9SACH|nr:LADA_0D03268g1_1 [Lachancea dasiensis]